MLPKVFAIYRSDSETFQLLTTESDESGNLVRLKVWMRPDAEAIASNPEFASWNNGGQEWYVVPTYNQGSQVPPQAHRLVLHGQEYFWWSLRHCLVWSDYLTHARRHDSTRDKWMMSPRIPILEFNSKLIHPRTYIETYPRWCESSPKKLEMESLRGAHEYKENTERPVLLSIHDHVDPRDLRIRTPPARDEEEEASPTSFDRAQHYCPRPKSWSSVSDDLIEDITSTLHTNKCTQITARAVLVSISSLFITGTLLMIL